MSERADRRVFLGMPGYGRQTEAAGMAFWNATASRFVQRARGEQFDTNEYRKGSLLASNFNQLWCSALNIVHQGGRLDYFAMLHDDVGPLDCGPTKYWLDMLIDELEERQLDVLSVVVPIKDRRGLTSMALQHPSDEWMPFARLSMHDVYQLPETFTADDLGRPLLLNTGCWVAKWNQDWCRQIHFSIEDRIVFNDSCNRYQAQTVPEDWHLSKQLNSLGRKIGATRKIAVNHRGEQDFANYIGSWGTDKFDKEAVRTSPVPGSFPSDIDGWLTEPEGRALAELARGKRVLEIGSFCGLSTVCLARTAESVTAVDYFDGRATPNPGDTRRAFDANIARYGVADKINVCHPDADWLLEAAHVFRDEEPHGFDLVFIDGDHSREAVERDIYKSRCVLRSGGLLAFHDYSLTDPGVMEAVNELLAQGGKGISRTDSLAVVQPPAAIPLEV